jgi:hypothetical protein
VYVQEGARAADNGHVPTSRTKALACAWFQWAAIVVFFLATIPPLALLVRAQDSATALTHDILTWEMIGTFLAGVAAILVQARVAQDGCFGVCAYPPVGPVSPGGTFWLRLGTQGLFWFAMAVGTLTILRWLPIHFGLVLSLGLLGLWLPVFGGLCLALGYEQVVPPRLRFFFALDTWWMVSRLRGRMYVAERSCTVALRDKTLSPENRLFAMELISTRPWVSGGLAAIQEIANAGDSVLAPLTARAREILATQAGTNFVTRTAA